jgi:hypothetical protein
MASQQGRLDRRLDLEVVQRIEDRDRHPEPLRQIVPQTGERGSAPGEQDLVEFRLALARGEKSACALDRRREAIHDRRQAVTGQGIQIIILVQALPGLLHGHAERFPEGLLEPAFPHRYVAGQQRTTVSDQADAGDLVTDVDEAERPVARPLVGVLERRLHREGVDLDDRGLEAARLEEPHATFHEVLLGGDDHHLHLRAPAIGVEDLEIEAHAVDVEGNVLLGFPAYDLPRLRLPHAVHADPLHDDVAAGHRGGGRPAADSGPLAYPPQRLDRPLEVHDLPRHDGLRVDRLALEGHQT